MCLNFDILTLSGNADKITEDLTLSVTSMLQCEFSHILSLLGESIEDQTLLTSMLQ